MQNSTVIGAISVRCISEGSEISVVRGKGLPDGLRLLLEDSDHKSSHQVGSVGLLIELGAAEVI